MLCYGCIDCGTEEEYDAKLDNILARAYITSNEEESRLYYETNMELKRKL